MRGGGQQWLYRLQAFGRMWIPSAWNVALFSVGLKSDAVVHWTWPALLQAALKCPHSNAFSVHKFLPSCYMQARIWFQILSVKWVLIPLCKTSGAGHTILYFSCVWPLVMEVHRRGEALHLTPGLSIVRVQHLISCAASGTVSMARLADCAKPKSSTADPQGLITRVAISLVCGRMTTMTKHSIVTVIASYYCTF